MRTIICLTVLISLLYVPAALAQAPKPTDDRLVIELVAKEPDIVTPTGLAVDERGRVWVIENHTHQRPKEYKGPPTDRIRIFDDFDAKGRARRVKTFAEGFKDGMGLAIDRTGLVYLATRSEIVTYRDKDGKAVDRKVIAKLDTKGDYPHNGLSGFAFDAFGDVYFGLGENLGEPYKLIGTGEDGMTLTGGGEGGSVYVYLTSAKIGPFRKATGFWNPFAQAVDGFERHFVVDNDPDSRGPCRLLHIIPGGDYGYRYRNGRKGLHPFTAWNGELPGTLPMVAGTAEAPSGIIAYESNGLPQEYRGQLITTSWGDHVIERFELKPRGASFTSQAKTLVKGGEDFRPVAIAVGPDGSIYLTDWVDKSYPVHGKGRIWRIRMKKPPTDDGLRPSKVASLPPEKLRSLLSHPKIEVRRAASDALVTKKVSKAFLLEGIKTADARGRVHALWTATRLDTETTIAVANRLLDDKEFEVRAQAIRVLGGVRVNSPIDHGYLEKTMVARAKKDPSPHVRLQAMLNYLGHEEGLVTALADKDPFLAAAALQTLGAGNASTVLPHLKSDNPAIRVGILLALRRTGDPEARKALPKFLDDPDPEVRRAAIQWVGEDGLKEYAKLIEKSAAKAPVTKALFEALLASQDFLSGKKRVPTDEPSGEEFVAKVLKDASQPAAFHVLAVRMLRPDHPALDPARLKKFLEGKDKALRREALRTLVMRPDEPSQGLLRGLVSNTDTESAQRAQAVMGLAHSATISAATRKLLFALLEKPELRREALQSLREVSGDEVERALLGWWDKNFGDKVKATDESRELAAQMILALRARKGAAVEKRLKTLAELVGPQPRNDKQWLEALSGRGDPAAGERVFFQPRGPRCYACHRVDGRGGAIGPDLSTIGRSTSREKLIESILAPSKEIAPPFVSWIITTKDGKSRTGIIVDEGPNSTITIADAAGKLETINRLDVEERVASKTSLMPDNLHELMTRQEFVDLLAFLAGLK
jgi:putative membrane-bound dehydrogenase-like protein